jgi:hypothetical protein
MTGCKTPLAFLPPLENHPIGLGSKRYPSLSPHIDFLVFLPAREIFILNLPFYYPDFPNHAGFKMPWNQACKIKFA